MKSAKNYGSMNRTDPHKLTNEELRASQMKPQQYTSSPLVNDLLTAAVQQMQALFNQQKLTPPPSFNRLKQIQENALNSADEKNEQRSVMLQLIGALTAFKFQEENKRIFIALAEQLSKENPPMSDTVKRDIIFILNCSLDALEGNEKNRVQKCIKGFEDSLKEEKKDENVSGTRRLSK